MVFLVLIAHQISFLNADQIICPAIGTPCSTNSNCCPHYVTDHGTFYGYCDGTCKPADGINGNKNENQWCKTELFDEASGSIDEYYDSFSPGCYGDGFGGILGWNWNSINDYSVKEGKHQCDLLFPGYSGAITGGAFTANYDYKGNQLRVFDDAVNPELLESTFYDTKGYGASYASISKISGQVVSSLDPVGNLLESKDANGNKVQNYYDNLDRLKKSIFYDSNGNKDFSIKYYYDTYSQFSGEESCSTTGNSLNLLCEIRDDSGFIKFRYDERTRVVWQEKTIYDEDFGRRIYTTMFEYDSLDNVRSVTLPSQDKLVYEYDSLNQLKKIKYWNQADGSEEVIADLSYTATGAIKQKVLNPNDAVNKIYADYEYDAKDQVIELYYSKQDSRDQGVSLFQRRIDYDEVGNVLGIRYNIDSSVQNEQYVYDNLYRLTHAVYPGKVFDYDYLNTLGDRQVKTVNAQTTTYTYDPIRNILISFIVSGGGSAPVGTTSLIYDERGNLLTSSFSGGIVNSFVYDSLNRMIQSLTGNVLVGEYTYDYTNKRIKKKTQYETTFYLYQGDNVLQEEVFSVDSCSVGCGNTDGDENNLINTDDINQYINFFYGVGESPILCASDVDGSGEVDISDLKYLIDFTFGVQSTLLCANPTKLSSDPLQGHTLEDIKNHITQAANTATISHPPIEPEILDEGIIPSKENGFSETQSNETNATIGNDTEIPPSNKTNITIENKVEAPSINDTNITTGNETIRNETNAQES